MTSGAAGAFSASFINVPVIMPSVFVRTVLRFVHNMVKVNGWTSTTAANRNNIVKNSTDD